MIARIKNFRIPLLGLSLCLLASCAIQPPDQQCPVGRQQLDGCPPKSALDDPEINQIHDSRTWVDQSDLEFDPIEQGKQLDIPVQHARARILGPTDQAALESLAAKLWMIENAEHTLDLVYYIYASDLVGKALAGALCNAVQRGVDVRLMVDSTGSISGLTHPTLKAIETCAENAGFMRNASGEITNRRARVQVVVFNAVTRFGNVNRRSHDKLLIMDGQFEGNSAVMTGGRNISVDYYGIDDEGQPAVDAYRDAEILVRSKLHAIEEDLTMGEMAAGYYSLLFLVPSNKRIFPGRSDGEAQKYWQERRLAQEALAKLKDLDHFRPVYESMDQFMSSGFRDTQVRLVHELGNLTDKKVVTARDQNKQSNRNSIMTLLAEIGDERPDIRHVRIVSPYLFLAEYKDKDGTVVRDEAEEFIQWIEDHPGATLEIVTNSVLTSDNFPAQSVIDMETAPRLLLTPDVREEWVSLKAKEETSATLVHSEAWKTLVNNPRVIVWETGRMDSNKLGGTQPYGKLHAKILFTEIVGFVGTTNFDYRSRLYNNEMGFFFDSEELIRDLVDDFEYLVSMSYRWGSPEWLEMRQKVMSLGGIKGGSTKAQRSWYRFFRNTGVIWLL